MDDLDTEMGEWMTTLPQIFEALCELLLEEMGYDVSMNARREVGFDKIGTKDGERLAVEVRWTHRPMVYKRLLSDWVPTTKALHLAEAATRVLMVSGTVEKQDIKWAVDNYDVKLWGRNELLKKAPEDLKPVLKLYFKVVDEESNPLRKASAEDRVAVTETVRTRIKEYKYGEKLGGQLRQVLGGKEDAKNYEQLCLEITNYLFRDILVDPQYQSYSDDGLSVLDIVYRISPNSGNEIWKTIARDFRSRVIVFECKNFSGSMGPLQVYTTERYLSPRALRTVCFMLTRLPPEPNAILAAQAAMRESGKLLVILHDEDLRQMLTTRDRQLKADPGSPAWIGNDPSEFLDRKIYEFLATMPR
ncbi:restriction endonuclease [Rhizobium sp. 9T]|uniref:restriction endonuclease n=1 Tax=Rhizobium croatiense TaxID=2867516 RepID=UPI001C9352C6|nr:restriction endonuclease [Rhizobium croatiense]MBY4606386.1 restriction endonuclease [Rhizobium croatiense]